MAAARTLRAVAPDEKPPRPLTLAEAIELGDPLEILLAQRRDIASRLPDAQGAPLAALHGQLLKISDKIDALRGGGLPKTATSAADGTDDRFDASAI